MTFRKVARAEELWSGEMAGVVVGTTKVLLVHVGGVVCAYVDACAHKGVEMSRGKLDGETLVCSAHEWRYDARSGLGENPRGVKLTPLPVKLEQGDILVDIGGER